MSYNSIEKSESPYLPFVGKSRNSSFHFPSKVAITIRRKAWVNSEYTIGLLRDKTRLFQRKHKLSLTVFCFFWKKKKATYQIYYIRTSRCFPLEYWSHYITYHFNSFFICMGNDNTIDLSLVNTRTLGDYMYSTCTVCVSNNYRKKYRKFSNQATGNIHISTGLY